MQTQAMAEFTRQQQLLMYLRNTFFHGNGTKLAKAINKDASYVLRLFYPPNKNGAKGIGPEITEACTATFGLVRGFWESDPSEWSDTHLPVIAKPSEASPSQPITTGHTQTAAVLHTPGADTYFGWPFGKRIAPWQYNSLSTVEKHDVEKYIRLLLKAKDPPSEHPQPANNEKTATHT
jgi:hypothetical protein